MEKIFQSEFKEIDTKAPKELVREYTTPGGEKVREVGPIVYGYSMAIGPDGRPKMKEFGNVKSTSTGTSPMLTSEREPLVDMTTNDKKVKVVVEMSGVKKENIKVNAYDSSVEISTVRIKRGLDSKGKYATSTENRRLVWEYIIWP